MCRDNYLHLFITRHDRHRHHHHHRHRPITLHLHLHVVATRQKYGVELRSTPFAESVLSMYSTVGTHVHGEETCMSQLFPVPFRHAVSARRGASRPWADTGTWKGRSRGGYIQYLNLRGLHTYIHQPKVPT